MGLFMQLLVNGLIAGSIYALVASGFSLIYSTNRFMHFAHGVAVVVAGYFLYSLFSLLRLNFWISVLLTLAFSGLIGFGMYSLIYLPLQRRKASGVILLIASIGLLILFENIILGIFGADVKTIGFLEIREGINILGARITGLQIVIIVISILLLFSLYFFMQKTKIGRDMRAVADNKDLAAVVGINEIKVADYSFIIGSIIAGIAGILIGMEQNLTPGMGTNFIVKGFSGAVVGGIFSVPASILGSYIIGFAENFGIWFLPSGYKDAIAFVLLFIFLLFKPSGLFGLRRDLR